MAKTPLTTRVVTALTAHPDGLTLEQIMAEVGASRTKIKSPLYNMVSQKRIVQHPANASVGDATFYPLGHGPAEHGEVKKTAPTETSEPPAASEDAERTPLSGDQARLLRFLDHLDVKAGPAQTIAETFFSTGDEGDMKRLFSLLTDAKAYVTSGQRRMIMRVWSDYTDTSIPEEIARIIDKDRPPEADGATGEDADVFGLGWRVEKDESGECMPVAGGEIKSYMQACRVATAMNASSGRGKHGEGDSGGKGSVIDPTVQILIDRAFPEEGRGGGKDTLDQVKAIVDLVVPKKAEGEESEVQTLRRQLQEERDRATQKQLADLNALVTAALQRDPVKEYLEMHERITALTGGPISDNSPTVQVLKDSTDKLERFGTRGLGLLERVVLRNQPLEPEGGSEEDQEQRAEGLANRLEGDSRQRQLKREVYGIG